MATILRKSDQAELCYLAFLQFLEATEGLRMRFMGAVPSMDEAEQLWAVVEKVPIILVDDYGLKYEGGVTAVRASELGGVIVIGEAAQLES